MSKDKKPILAYMTYPLSNGNFEKNRIKAEKLANQIMQKNPNIFVLLAHNATHFSDRVERYKPIEFDIAIIGKIDMLILGKNLDYNESSGSCWEYCLAKTLGKKTVTSDYLLGNSKEPMEWSPKTVPIQFNF
jgi:hypothetical protein